MTIFGGSKFKNPSLQVANEFNIGPDELSGIVFFTLSGDQTEVSEGVYFPLKTELFSGYWARVEEVFRDLFSIIQESKQATNSPQELLKTLDSRFRSMHRKLEVRPVVEYLSRAIVTIDGLPGQSF